MYSSYVSTASLTEATRTALIKAQSKMAEAQKELASGRHADVGRTLGARTAQTVSFRREYGQLQTTIDTNNVLDSRLQFTQQAMQSLTDGAANFIKSVISGSASTIAAEATEKAASGAIKAFTDVLNTSYDGDFIFGGININDAPIADYFATSPPSPSKQAVDQAFFNQFGFAQDDPAVAGITATDMQTFIDGPFAALFDSSNWAGTWSSASDTNISSRISPRDTMETSTNANEQPFRDMAQALTMIADLGGSKMNDSARKVVYDKAMKMAGEAVSGINNLRAGIGISQEQISLSTERMTVQINTFDKDVGLLENVDPAEVSVRISALTTQLEASYSLTARLLRLSLVNYL